MNEKFENKTFYNFCILIWLALTNLFVYPNRWSLWKLYLLSFQLWSEDGQTFKNFYEHENQGIKCTYRKFLVYLGSFLLLLAELLGKNKGERNYAQKKLININIINMIFYDVAQKFGDMSHDLYCNPILFHEQFNFICF